MNKKRISAVDIFVVLLFAVAVVGIGIKLFSPEGGAFQGEEADYYVSYSIAYVDSEMAKCFADGAEFYTEDEKLFGKVTGDIITTPAKIYNENSKGEYVVGYSSGSNIDISGTLTVRGRMTESGFVVSGRYYCANMEVSLLGEGVAVDVLITDIVKAD
ncbi:MAG: DUF4330 family protein [Clostridia bacterium]|nr:DUF4330 family protein [Clostridia bacterium]